MASPLASLQMFRFSCCCFRGRTFLTLTWLTLFCSHLTLASMLEGARAVPQLLVIVNFHPYHLKQLKLSLKTCHVSSKSPTWGSSYHSRTGHDTIRGLAHPIW